MHRAADGGLARVRVPGGRLSAAQLVAVADAAVDLGNGTLDLTSRANLQVRGLAEGAEIELGTRLAEVGLLPSPTHEKVRNIMSSPFGGPGLAAELDHALCARPALASLPGRFLFALDDGRGDVAWLGADVTALPVGGRVAVLLGGVDYGVRVAMVDVVETLLACAEAFLDARVDQWRIAELGHTVAEIADRLSAGPDRVPMGEPVTTGPVGPVMFADGEMGVAATVPLGRLTRHQVRAITGGVVLTPWRGIVVPGGDVDMLAAAGLLVDPDAPGIGVTACTGKPGCAKALADVRADAARVTMPGLPVHWSGCARGCGRPVGDVLDVVATVDGYQVDGRAVPGDSTVITVVTETRQERS